MFRDGKRRLETLSCLNRSASNNSSQTYPPKATGTISPVSHLSPPRNPYTYVTSPYASLSDVTLISPSSGSSEKTSGFSTPVIPTVRLIDKPQTGVPLTREDTLSSNCSSDEPETKSTSDSNLSLKDEMDDTFARGRSREPQLSWALTVILLVGVTVVSKANWYYIC